LKNILEDFYGRTTAPEPHVQIWLTWLM